MKLSRSDPLKALSDTLRISLFELIKEGPKTTPELAEILDENRINLYHHLKMLENAGLISSSYNSERVKVYRADSAEPEIQHQEQATIIKVSPDPTPNVETIVLSPPSDPQDYLEYKKTITKLAKICGKELRSDQEILQVQITAEEKKYFEMKAARSTSIMQKRRK